MTDTEQEEILAIWRTRVMAFVIFLPVHKFVMIVVVFDINLSKLSE